MEFKDYYKTLGVARTASNDEVKRAYRKLARKFHPDVSKEPDAEKRMQEVNEAWEVLGDPEKRAAYDELGSRWQAGQQFRPPPDWDAGFEFSGSHADAREFSDFFSSLFGGMGRTQRREGFRARGEDHHAKILIDLEDAFRGASRSISLRSPQVDAQGRVALKERTLNVRIPAGIRDGQQMRLAGQGAAGLGGAPAGDLFLEVRFNPHSLYRVEGADLYLTLPVAPWEAALGATVRAPTPAGVVEAKIPAGSQSGRQLRLRGRGIPGPTPGDLYLVLQVVLPEATSAQARALYEQMGSELAFNPRKSLGV